MPKHIEIDFAENWREIIMNIIFLIGQLRYSGAENVLRCITPQIARAGNNVEILVRATGYENETLPDVKIKFCGAEGNAIQRRFGRNKKIREEINNFKADAVIGFGFPMNFDAVAASIGTSAKSIICERMDPYTCSHNRKFELQKNIYYRFADGYVVQTPLIQMFYKQHYAGKKKIAIIPNPVREGFFSVQKRNATEDYLITVGRLDDQQKNQSMLINAFSKVANKYPELKLYIAGEGPDRKKYEELIEALGLQRRVKLLGNVSDPTSVVRDSALFLLTSNHEGMPNALIEAMAQGKPCISTKCSGGGAEYLINDGENGILIDCNDVEACALAIDSLMSDESKRRMFGEKAFEVNQMLNLEAITNRWISYLSDICRK